MKYVMDTLYNYNNLGIEKLYEVESITEHIYNNVRDYLMNNSVLTNLSHRDNTDGENGWNHGNIGRCFYILPPYESDSISADILPNPHDTYKDPEGRFLHGFNLFRLVIPVNSGIKKISEKTNEELPVLEYDIKRTLHDFFSAHYDVTVSTKIEPVLKTTKIVPIEDVINYSRMIHDKLYKDGPFKDGS
jgi:hypothetical protein